MTKDTNDYFKKEYWYQHFISKTNDLYVVIWVQVNIPLIPYMSVK